MTKKEEIWNKHGKDKSLNIAEQIYDSMEEYGKYCAREAKNKYLTEATAMLRNEITEFTMFEDWWNEFKTKQ